MSIKPEELEKALNTYFNDYVEDINEEVRETTDKLITQAKNDLKATSPKGKGLRDKPYHLGWALKTPNRGKNRYHRVVWNKTNYQLTHLLEFGHHKKDGTGWVEAQPHIRPIEEKYKVKFTETLINKIRRQK